MLNVSIECSREASQKALSHRRRQSISLDSRPVHTPVTPSRLNRHLRSRADIENSLSSFPSEFDSGCIAHAGGAGGAEHARSHYQQTSRNTQPASASNNINPKLFIISEITCFLRSEFGVEFRQGLLGNLLIFQCLAGLRRTVSDP